MKLISTFELRCNIDPTVRGLRETRNLAAKQEFHAGNIYSVPTSQKTLPCLHYTAQRVNAVRRNGIKTLRAKNIRVLKKVVHIVTVVL
jgi:hypothetical protein